MQEIKVYIDEPYLAMFKEDAKREGRSLRHHARRIIEGQYEQPVRRTARPSKPIFKSPHITVDGEETLS